MKLSRSICQSTLGGLDVLGSSLKTDIEDAVIITIRVKIVRSNQRLFSLIIFDIFELDIHIRVHYLEYVIA